VICAQSIHSSLELALTYPDQATVWNREGGVVVVLGVPDEYALTQCGREVAALGGKVAWFREADLDNEITSFACFVDETSVQPLRKLNLLLGRRQRSLTPASSRGGE
jgi:hypothetical protein